MNIGFIGLGSLGTPIAVNLLESGHVLHVYNRTQSKALSLADKGAILASDIGSLAKASDIVFTIVSDDAAIKEVCKSGLLENMKPGSIHISMSTILPETAKELALLHEKNSQHYFAAPVFGRPDAAAARKANFAVSGKQEIRVKAEPLLRDAGAAGIFYFGEDITAANTVKLSGNFLIAAAMEAIGESIRLAQKSHVDPQQMWSMFLQTIFNAPVYHNYSHIILHKKFEPASFSAKLGLKDLNLVMQQAAQVNQSMPLATLLQSHLQQLVAQNGETQDWSAISSVIDEKS